MINPSLNSMISAHLDKVKGHSANGEILIKRVENLSQYVNQTQSNVLLKGLIG